MRGSSSAGRTASTATTLAGSLKAGELRKKHDPYDAALRVHAKQDLYNAPNQCSIFRPSQGWTSLSSTGMGEGTLRFSYVLKLAPSYWIIRPFFRARNPASASLKWTAGTRSTSTGRPSSAAGWGRAQASTQRSEFDLRPA
ncbi:hypothetical protein B0H15DRAFT_36441 [Mycena belliarum]|uniref:Uncharacterized protein n=1 Tax=Mycena belliarum TaxID=1033014 RepID=A0AAD6XW94_9AGAR|nr:hypothetical protein B0H15DRAFT_36441 [Mycena belliae]